MLRNDPGLHVPEPLCRPGDEADFSRFTIPAAGALRRPPVHVDAAEIRDFAFSLIWFLYYAYHSVAYCSPNLRIYFLLKFFLPILLSLSFYSLIFLFLLPFKPFFFFISSFPLFPLLFSFFFFPFLFPF